MQPEPSKFCEFCDEEFFKSSTCSRVDWLHRRFCSPGCKQESQIGVPNPNKGKKFPRLPDEVRYLPCRICGRPTKIGRWRNAKEWYHCGRPECREKSKAIRLERSSATLKEGYSTGRLDASRWKHSWDKVERISPEEKLLWPELQRLGFQQQLKVLTGEKGIKKTRTFWLDFGLLEQMIYVEIDGSSHRSLKRKQHDARRDQMLATLGWRGLRIRADRVRDELSAVTEEIQSFMKG